MNYCSACGQSITVRMPPGDNRERNVCNACGVIHYQNPKIVAGCVAVWQDKILLCQRAIEPRYGYWTVPAGFVENGESTLEGAVRETLEEANARIENVGLYGVYNLSQINQLYMMYRAELSDGKASPGEESLAVELVDESAVPWDDIAFPVVTETLQRFFEQRRSGQYQINIADIVRQSDGGVSVRRLG